MHNGGPEQAGRSGKDRAAARSVALRGRGEAQQVGRQGEVRARIEGEWGREAARHLERARSAAVASERNKCAGEGRAANGRRRLFESIPAVMQREPGGQARGGRRFVPSSQAARAEPLRVAQRWR